MTETVAPRAVNARIIRGTVVVTGDSNTVGSLPPVAEIARTTSPVEIANPAPATPMARVLDVAIRADDFTAHAGAIAGRIGAAIRWAIGSLLR